MARRVLILAACVLTVALLTGCARSPAEQRITAWTFVAQGVSREVTLPAHFDRWLPNTPSAYELHARVVLSPDLCKGPISLSIPYFPALVALRANDRDLTSTTTEAFDVYRTDAQNWVIPADLAASGALDLELRVDRNWTQSAWLDTIPRLSATTHGDAAFLAVHGFNIASGIVAAVALLLVGLLYGLVPMLARREVAYAWFAVEAVGAMAFPTYPAGLLQPLIGRYEVAVGAFGLDVAMIATVYFTHGMLGTAKPSRAWLAALAVLGGGAIAFGGPFQATRFVVIPTLAMVASTVAFQIRAARRAWRSGAAPLNTFIVTLGSPVAMLVATPDITAWLGFGELLGGLRLGPLATAGIAVMQSVAFSRTHILSLTRSDALNAELAGRVALLESQNRQIAVLNDELRHQITARSAELSDALAKLNTDAEGAIELGPEDVVGDRYRILRRLGSGAAGVVYEVVRVSDEQPFALKIMRGPRDRVALARFAREAQMAAQIRHPNVVSLVDIDVESRGILFLVMDLVLGPSLRAARERFGDTAWALPILRQVAEGLAAIHTQGIVHRDLKPANVILADRGDGVPPLVKIADFGIASLILDSADEETRREGDAPRAPPSTPSTPSDSRSKSDGSLTETGVVLGTPMYMAPEALIGARHAQGPADVFSFGVMAVELLTGARPFGDTPASVALPSGRTLSTSLRDPSRALAAEVAVLVEQCLRVDASERPTAGDLVRVFARQLPSSGTLAVGGRAKVERR